MIILGAKNEAKLHQIRKFLIDNGIRHVHFYESDLDDALTALATEPLHGDQRKLFRRFQLLRSKVPPVHATAKRYALQYPDGSYYRYAGDCGRSPHKTWAIEDANLASSPDGFWETENGRVVEVNLGYTVKGGVK